MIKLRLCPGYNLNEMYLTFTLGKIIICALAYCVLTWSVRVGRGSVRTLKLQRIYFDDPCIPLWSWSYRKSELRINKASLADSGEYMCKVISKLGNDSASANITIVDSNGKRDLLHSSSHSVREVIKVCGKTCNMSIC